MVFWLFICFASDQLSKQTRKKCSKQTVTGMHALVISCFYFSSSLSFFPYHLLFLHCFSKKNFLTVPRERNEKLREVKREKRKRNFCLVEKKKREGEGERASEHNWKDIGVILLVGIMGDNCQTGATH